MDHHHGYELQGCGSSAVNLVDTPVGPVLPCPLSRPSLSPNTRRRSTRLFQARGLDLRALHALGSRFPEAIHPYWGSDGGYINFMSGDDDHRAAAHYGANDERLAAKVTYDPDNLFHINQNIALAKPS